MQRTTIRNQNRDKIEADIDDLEQRIRKNIEVLTGFQNEETQAYKLELKFLRYDTTKLSYLTFEEFTMAMIEMNFVGVQRAVKGLFERYDVDGNGHFPYKDFSKYLYNLIPNPQGSAEYRYSIQRFKDSVYELDGILGIRTLRQIWKTADKYKDYKLLKDELVRTLRNEGYSIPEIDAKVIMRCFDKSGDGFVEYDDFFNGIRGSIRYVRKLLISKLFKLLDKEDNGYITIDDITKNYDISKYPPVSAGKLNEEDGWKHFLYSWDLNEDKISEEQFMDYYLDIGGLIYDNDDFEAMMKECWKVNL